MRGYLCDSCKKCLNICKKFKIVIWNDISLEYNKEKPIPVPSMWFTIIFLNKNERSHFKEIINIVKFARNNSDVSEV